MDRLALARRIGALTLALAAVATVVALAGGLYGWRVPLRVLYAALWAPFLASVASLVAFLRVAGGERRGARLALWGALAGLVPAALFWTAIVWRLSRLGPLDP